MAEREVKLIPWRGSVSDFITDIATEMVAEELTELQHRLVAGEGRSKVMDAPLPSWESCIEIDVARDFSRVPAGRYHSDGPTSAQAFRPMLVVAMRSGRSFRVLMDGGMGYGSSFLEEAFGGLVRLKQWTIADICKRMRIVSSNPPLIAEVWSYVKDAASHG